jgi:predicted MPP superfamily phosphohydrolase
MSHLNRPARAKARLIFLHGAVPFCFVLAGVLVIGLGVAFAIDAFWIEPASIRLTEYRLPLEGADAQKLRGLRIAVIADLHAGAPYIDDKKIERIVSMTNATKPGLILLVGDYVVGGVPGGKHMPIEHIAGLLKPLAAPMGVYAVLGNHDHWENGPVITDSLRKAGIIPISNASFSVVFGPDKLYLAGIDDYVTHHSNPAAALKAVPIDRRAICFTHSPDIFPLLSDKCILTIAGHTHGGQVSLPLLGRLVVPSKYGQHYAAGFRREGSKYIFVSTGIGTSIIPIRFGVPPEISLLVIS